MRNEEFYQGEAYLLYGVQYGAQYGVYLILTATSIIALDTAGGEAHTFSRSELLPALVAICRSPGPSNIPIGDDGNLERGVSAERGVSVIYYRAPCGARYEFNIEDVKGLLTALRSREVDIPEPVA